MTLLAYALDRLFDSLLVRYARGLRREAEEREQALDPVMGEAVSRFSRSFVGPSAERPAGGDMATSPLEGKAADVVYESAEVLTRSLRDAYEARISLPGISSPSEVEVRELPGSLEVKARLPGARTGYFAIVRKPSRFSCSPSSRVEDGSLVLRWE